MSKNWFSSRRQMFQRSPRIDGHGKANVGRAGRTLCSMRSFFGAVVSCAVSVILLAGCAAGPTVDDDLYAYLSPREHHNATEINFDQVIPGSWTRMVIVCAGATKGDLDKALGFEWKDAPSLRASSNFISMVVFARKTMSSRMTTSGQIRLLKGNGISLPAQPTFSVIQIRLNLYPYRVAVARSSSRFRSPIFHTFGTSRSKSSNVSGANRTTDSVSLVSCASKH